MPFSYSRRLRAKNTCLSNVGKINRFCKGSLRGINSTATDPLTSSTTGLRTVWRKIFSGISRMCDYKFFHETNLRNQIAALKEHLRVCRGILQKGEQTLRVSLPPRLSFSY